MTSAAAVLEAGRVTRHDKEHPPPDTAFVDYGLGGLTSTLIDLVGAETTELSEPYSLFAARSLLFGYDATERFYEIGRVESRRDTDEFLRGYWGRTE